MDIKYSYRVLNVSLKQSGHVVTISVTEKANENKKANEFRPTLENALSIINNELEINDRLAKIETRQFVNPKQEAHISVQTIVETRHDL